MPKAFPQSSPRRLSDRSRNKVLRCETGHACNFAYIDNLGILLGSSRSEVVGVIERSKVQFNSKFLLLHEVEVQSGRAKVLGMVSDCERFMTMNSWDRFGGIRKSMQYFFN